MTHRDINGVQLFGMSIRVLAAVVLFLIHPGLALIYGFIVAKRCRDQRANGPLSAQQLGLLLEEHDRQRADADVLIARQQEQIDRYLRRPVTQ